MPAPRDAELAVRTTVQRELHLASMNSRNGSNTACLSSNGIEQSFAFSSQVPQVSTMCWIAASRGPRTSVNASAAGAPGPHRAPPARPSGRTDPIRR